MDTNVESDNTLSNGDNLIVPSLNNLKIEGETESNKESDINKNEKCLLADSEKQNLNDQKSMVNVENNFANNLRQPINFNGNRRILKNNRKKSRNIDSVTMKILNEPQIIPEGWKTMEFIIDFNNVVYVEGSKSIYSPVYSDAPFQLSEQYYNSVDDVYQINKLNDLCGPLFAQQYCDKKTTADKRAFVREIINFINISKEDIIDWRSKTGLDVIFNATVEKFTQNEKLMDEMIKDKEKLIINIYGNDPIDGCCDKEMVDAWIANNKGNICVMPAEENPSNLLNFPTIGSGKNVQGIMVMLARYAILNNNN